MDIFHHHYVVGLYFLPDWSSRRLRQGQERHLVSQEVTNLVTQYNGDSIYSTQHDENPQGIDTTFVL